MDPNDITLESIDKLFEYEKHARAIDDLNLEELKKFTRAEQEELYMILRKNGEEVSENRNGMFLIY